MLKNENETQRDEAPSTAERDKAYAVSDTPGHSVYGESDTRTLTPLAGWSCAIKRDWEFAAFECWIDVKTSHRKCLASPCRTSLT